MVSTISEPLKMKRRQGSFAAGLRASGGSWYFRTMEVPSALATVLVAAARRPVGLKFGCCFSTSGLSSARTMAVLPSFSPEKAAACEGSGPLLL
jgi:hypothetical protein